MSWLTQDTHERSLETAAIEFRNRLEERRQSLAVNQMKADYAAYSTQLLTEGWIDEAGEHKALKQWNGEEMMAQGFSPSQAYAAQMSKWMEGEAKRRGLSPRMKEAFAIAVTPGDAGIRARLADWELGEQAKAGVLMNHRSQEADWTAHRKTLMAGIEASRASEESAEAFAGARPPTDYAALVEGEREFFAQRVRDYALGDYSAKCGTEGFAAATDRAINFCQGQLDGTVATLCDAGEFGAAKALCGIFGEVDGQTLKGEELAREKLKWVEGEEAKWLKQRALDAAAKAKAEQAQRSYEYITENHDWATACRKLQFWANSEDISPVEREVYQKQANLLMSGFPKGVWKPEDVADLLDRKAMNLNWLRARNAGVEDVQKAQMDLCVSIEAAMYHGALEPKRYERLMKTVREELSNEKKDALKALATAFGVALDGDKVSKSVVEDAYGTYRPFGTYRLEGAGELSGREFSTFYTEVCDALDAMNQKIDRKAATTELIADIKRRYAEKKWDRLASVSATEFFKDYERDRLAGMDYGGHNWDGETDADDDWPRGGVETREGWTREEKYAEDHPLGAKSLAPLFGGWGDEVELSNNRMVE